MINKEEARNLVLEKVSSIWTIEDSEPVILNASTIERDFGWVFFYESSKYLKTNEFSDMVLGNAPIIVNKFDGSLHYTGTAYETEYYVSEYERTLESSLQD